jgi:hypothetical protein
LALVAARSELARGDRGAQRTAEGRRWCAFGQPRDATTILPPPLAFCAEQRTLCSAASRWHRGVAALLGRFLPRLGPHHVCGSFFAGPGDVSLAWGRWSGRHPVHIRHRSPPPRSAVCGPPSSVQRVRCRLSLERRSTSSDRNGARRSGGAGSHAAATDGSRACRGPGSAGRKRVAFSIQRGFSWMNAHATA